MSDHKNYSIKRFEEDELDHLKYFTDFLSNEIQLFEKNIDYQAYLLNACLITFALYSFSAVDSVMLQAHVKSVRLLYNAHKLTLQGNHAIAKTLFKQIFEYQLIGKYFHSRNDESEAERWLEKNDFNVNKMIFKQLEKPSEKNLSNFWKFLCAQAQTTTSDCHQHSDIDGDREEIYTTYHMILMLICLESNSLGFLCQRKNLIRLQQMVGCELYSELVDNKRNLKELVKSTLGLLADPRKTLVSDYKSKWTFKPFDSRPFMSISENKY